MWIMPFPFLVSLAVSFVSVFFLNHLGIIGNNPVHSNL